ncbi:MAG: nucleoside phosphorylase [Anaerolineaceae bacterium]|nr:nucleoside phosphorylase [Anaerolineaceae bacterium]
MEHHIKCNPEDVSRYVFCPGSQERAKIIADYFDDMKMINDERGIDVYSGTYKGVHMTSCGTGMGGPVVAIALEELAHMGADTFIRVGSCGVFQDHQQPGDIIIGNGTFRAGGTANSYLPLAFPAVPTYEVLEELVNTARRMGLPYEVGVGVAGDAFYAPGKKYADRDLLIKSGVLSVEMESDTLFIIGQYRGWRTGALYVSDGTNKEMKASWGWDKFAQGQKDMIELSLEAMLAIAEKDKKA